MVVVFVCGLGGWNGGLRGGIALRSLTRRPLAVLRLIQGVILRRQLALGSNATE